MQFPIGSTVELSMYTGDDQIDFYYGFQMKVVEYTPIPARVSGSGQIENYKVQAPDFVIISVNEYELQAADD